MLKIWSVILGFLFTGMQFADSRILGSAPLFKVGVANIYFMAALFENNVEKPIFQKPENPPSKEIEAEFDRLSREFLARYIRYLDMDVLVICEAPSEPAVMQKFSDEYLDGRYTVIHNFPVVKNKKYYFNQQVAAFVDKEKFQIRRYEALSSEKASEGNRLYPFYPYKEIEYKGEKKKIFWSRFPIEFDLELKARPGHWYKFIAAYPKSKFARGHEQALFARVQNRTHQEMIRDRVEKAALDFEDIFVLGDLNDSIGMDPVEEELGTDSIASLYQGSQDPLLWNSVIFPPGQGSFLYKGEPETIDFILTSRGLMKSPGVVKPSVWQYDAVFRMFVKEREESTPDRLNHRELFISDHGPVTVEVWE